MDQLNGPTDVLINKETNSVFIADRDNRRVFRWSQHQETPQGEAIVENVWYVGLTIDHQRYLHVSDVVKDEVRRYTIGNKNGMVAAGGNGKGNQLNPLNHPMTLKELSSIYRAHSI